MNQGVLDGLMRPGFSVEPWRSMGGVSYEPVASSGSLLGSTQTWPGTANTLTSWVLITASSPYDCCAIDVVIFGGQANSTDSAALFDIGTGANGAETVLIDGIPIYGRVLTPLTIRFHIRKPGGTRFVWRMQAADTTITSTPAVAIGFIRDI